jgi:hypothetical protein
LLESSTISFISQGFQSVRIILIAASTLILSLITACSITTSNGETVFPYYLNSEASVQKTIKKVVLAPISITKPVPSYLRGSERKTRAMVKSYLEDMGYEILPKHHFENAWQQAKRTYGDTYDPTTGKVKVKAWRGAMKMIGESIREKTDADIIIFAELYEHEIQHSYSGKHYARWYGVTRPPALKGTGSGVPLDFNWGESIRAASLTVTIYNTNLDRIFSSRGGIDILEAIDLKRATPTFVKKKKLLTSNANIEEGIQLAFHPFITMKKYPGKPQQKN